MVMQGWYLLILIIVGNKTSGKRIFDTIREKSGLFNPGVKSLANWFDLAEKLEDYVMGVRIAVCNSEWWNDDATSSFQELVAALANNYYCPNLTACHTENCLPFTQNDVVFIEGYPRWDISSVLIRFILHYPCMNNGRIQLAPNNILSEMIEIELVTLREKFGWDIISYDKKPKYDRITDFMNKALLPLSMLAIGVYLLAYCSSHLSKNKEMIQLKFARSKVVRLSYRRRLPSKSVSNISREPRVIVVDRTLPYEERKLQIPQLSRQPSIVYKSKTTKNKVKRRQNQSSDRKSITIGSAKSHPIFRSFNVNQCKKDEHVVLL